MRTPVSINAATEVCVLSDRATLGDASRVFLSYVDHCAVLDRCTAPYQDLAEITARALA
jgi:hypothetical protein